MKCTCIKPKEACSECVDLLEMLDQGFKSYEKALEIMEELCELKIKKARLEALNPQTLNQ